MHLWILNALAEPPAPEPAPQREPIDRAVAGIIGCIGRGDFGTAALGSLNAALALDSWSIYRVFRARPPCLHASGSYRVADTTADCFRAYQDGLAVLRTLAETLSAGALNLVLARLPDGIRLMIPLTPHSASAGA